MIKLNEKENKVIIAFLQKQEMQSSDLHNELTKAGEDVSLVTVKRILSGLAKKGAISVKGRGRATAYELTVPGRIFAKINANEYLSTEPDKRYGLSGYNFNLFPAFPSKIFTENELRVLDEATAEYKKRTKELPEAIQKKELERLVIELSWKSSKIEGNTYTLLDTENLILKNEPAVGKTKEETQMILNHKNAFDFAHENKSFFKEFTEEGLQKLHEILVKDLNINPGFRKNPVGVSGSIYRPLDNVYQITEAVEALSAAVNRMRTPYAKSFLTLLGISYVQPFEDGNKRTGRLMADALLMANGLAALSYRSVEEKEYKEAVLVFYELNSVEPLKKIFVDQYDFAARRYAVK